MYHLSHLGDQSNRTIYNKNIKNKKQNIIYKIVISNITVAIWERVLFSKYPT